MRQQRGSFTGGSQASPSRPQSGGNGVGRSVAIKMLQPMHPGPGASENTLAAFKAGQSKWERDPPQYACKAYCTARQELNILIHLKVVESEYLGEIPPKFLLLLCLLQVMFY